LFALGPELDPDASWLQKHSSRSVGKPYGIRVWGLACLLALLRDPELAGTDMGLIPILTLTPDTKKGRKLGPPSFPTIGEVF